MIEFCLDIGPERHYREFRDEAGARHWARERAAALGTLRRLRVRPARAGEARALLEAVSAMPRKVQIEV